MRPDTRRKLLAFGRIWIAYRLLADELMELPWAWPRPRPVRAVAGSLRVSRQEYERLVAGR